MGNMLPSLFQARSNTLPPMNTKAHWSGSMKLLARTLRRAMHMRRPCRVSMVKAAFRESSSSAAAAEQATPRTRRAQRNGHQRRRVVRVKVVLTREEAARLLSFTEHGDRTAAQVVRELKRMQVIHAIASATATTAWRPVLQSIPEEWP